MLSALWGKRHTGEVKLLDYGRLCYLVEALKLDKLVVDMRTREGYASGAAAVIIEAFPTAKDEKPIKVCEINGNGQIELWAIQQAIDGIAASIVWTPEK